VDLEHSWNALQLDFSDGGRLHHVTRGIITSRILGITVDDGVGIVALTNADTKEGPIQDIVLKATAIALSSRNSSPSPSSSPPTVTIARRSDPPLPRRQAGVTPHKDDN
jgi:hypothetical protein